MDNLMVMDSIGGQVVIITLVVLKMVKSTDLELIMPQEVEVIKRGYLEMVIISNKKVKNKYRKNCQVFDDNLNQNNNNKDKLIKADNIAVCNYFNDVKWKNEAKRRGLNCESILKEYKNISVRYKI